MRALVALLILNCAIGCGEDSTTNPGNGSGSGGSAGTGAAAGTPSGAGSQGVGGAGAVGGSSGASGVAGTAGTPDVGGNGGAAPSGGTAGAATSGGTGGAATSGGSGGAPNAGNGGAGGAAMSGAGGMAGSAGGGAAGDGNLIGGTLATDSLAVRFANAVMARWPDPGSINGGINAFEYNRGIVLVGMQRVFEGTRDMRYLTYIRRYIDEFVDANGNVNRPTEHSFDTIQPAVLLPFLFEQTGQNKYAVAADKIRALYDSIPKNSEGGFWHKQLYPNEMWLDSVYMGEPFLAKYGRIRTCGAFCNDTPVTQMTLIATHVEDATSGLLYHAWDADRNATWANATTGRSPIIWGRALGWYAMALVDILAYLPSDHPGRAQLLTILSNVARGIQSSQDSGTGLWRQVVDQGTRTDDFLESSGSAMFVYALKLASARGYIAASYADVAARGFTGLMSQVSTDATGPVINGAVEGMGVQMDYANYVNKRRLTNSSHGLCGILLAASAMEAR